jgi:hypothetical protein
MITLQGSVVPALLGLAHLGLLLMQLLAAWYLRACIILSNINGRNRASWQSK